ncbi:reverse transcriptase family protein [Halomonas sp. MCCC 1A11062]|uniref:reverse transcriptase family protein n=1 Tax=Halomonas sp. MCCC 1A11062 TaxID=2733485 RepID=UPI001F34D942|nr:reverse transcriptase family protein [Halomonas sp. MCCC 1A11062]MCE8039285.1 RNA-directed DNA polymerase [Halomonas sp. MCCC 1A11062]
MADKPYYPHAPISNIDTLAKMLGVRSSLLILIANKANSSYVSFEVETKNKQRMVNEPKTILKYIQKKINSQIFNSVEFPAYLMGGIRDPKTPRDYISNAAIHAKAKTLISLDVKDFFPTTQEVHIKSVFKNLFNFPEDVSNTLTKLVSLNGRLPQGGCTSSYVANLIFHNSEYKVVSQLRQKGIRYTRLLDDITLSANRPLSKNECEKYIRLVAGMITKHDLTINSGKTKVEYSKNIASPYEVTGAWVRHGKPKLRKKERNEIRHIVHIVEKKYAENPYDKEYHDLWNKASGLVAKLKRFEHINESKGLRKKLKATLPLYDDQKAETLRVQANKLLRRQARNTLNYNSGTKKSIDKLVYDLGILSRTRPEISKPLKKKIKDSFTGIDFDGI